MAEWITVKEAAELLKISQRHIRNKIQTGQLKAKRDGRSWLVHGSLSSEIREAEGIPKGNQREIEKLEEIVGILKEQIEEKDRQIEKLQSQITEMEEARQRTDTIMLQLTRQVEQAQQLAAYYQQPFWKRWREKQKQLGEGARKDEK